MSEINLEEMLDVYGPQILDIGLKVLSVLVILLVGWIAASWLSRLAGKALTKARVEITLVKFLRKLVKWALLILVFIMCLERFGYSITTFAALIGAAGLAIGLAFQGSLSNFAAGIMLLVFRPFRVGDVVKVAGETGVIDEIAMFLTTMNTFENKRLFIPNGEIFGSVIENITYHPERRVDVNVGVAYDADLDETRRVLEEAAQSVEGGLRGEDRDPAVILLELADSSVNWQVRVWAPSPDFLTIKQATIRATKMALDNAGLGIPFPQMDVHLDRVEK